MKLSQEYLAHVIAIEEIAAFGPEAGAEGDGERAEIARSPFDD